ncbi:hypothetical protein Rhopal_001440-T1 [Rhodotorula paludigena]|uniref:Uncharacterized protein n=1 Tax=Rhodotorula paludigena TaxID=86838 RepID=A0AAV5GGT7_9BASI|nr:hypothetical protein Rhopal_001440-T1 [Rhodotorula paludigena]
MSDDSHSQYAVPSSGRPDAGKRSASSSSTDLADIGQRTSRTSAVSSEAPSTTRQDQRKPSTASKPPPSSFATAVRPHPPSSLRHGSSSIAPSTRSDSIANGSKPRKKHFRPRPVNLAGPTPTERIRAVPDFLQRRESDRTPGSMISSAQESGGEGSFVDPNGGSGSAKKPLWAMGGVFPKHAAKRRRSSLAKDWEEGERRRSAGSTGSVERPERVHRSSRPETGAPISATRTDSGTPSFPSDVNESALSTTSGSAGGRERTDPFEDLDFAESRQSRTGGAPLEVVVSQDTDRSKEEQADRLKAAIAQEDDTHAADEENPDELRKVHSGSSRTVAGDAEHEQGAKGNRREQEKEGMTQEEQDQYEKEHPEMREQGHGQQALGGELDQSKDQWHEDIDPGDDLPVRNWWGTVRYALREPLAEFLGAIILIVIGLGADCQTKLSQNTMGVYQSMNWSWGFGVMISMVPRYVFAQVVGAFVGALMIYGKALYEYDPYKQITAASGTNASATLFITAPSQGISSTIEGFCQEILAGGVLTIAVLALGDENNAPPGAGLGAIVLGFVVVAIGMSNGWISGYAINPARDLGPRLALWCLGYGMKLWHHDHWWWIVGPICGPLVGGIAGALAYDILIFTGPGSPINYSGTELADAIGLHSVHNMVWIALSPQKRRERRLARNPHAGEDDLAENGLANTLARQQSAKAHPGRVTEEQRSELALNRRWRRGKAKVDRQTERSRQRERTTMQEYRRSIEELRERERQRDGPQHEAEILPALRNAP